MLSLLFVFAWAAVLIAAQREVYQCPSPLSDTLRVDPCPDAPSELRYYSRSNFLNFGASGPSGYVSGYLPDYGKFSQNVKCEYGYRDATGNNNHRLTCTYEGTTVEAGETVRQATPYSLIGRFQYNLVNPDIPCPIPRGDTLMNTDPTIFYNSTMACPSFSGNHSLAYMTEGFGTDYGDGRQRAYMRTCSYFTRNYRNDYRPIVKISEVCTYDEAGKLVPDNPGFLERRPFDFCPISLCFASNSDIQIPALGPIMTAPASTATLSVATERISTSLTSLSTPSTSLPSIKYPTSTSNGAASKASASATTLPAPINTYPSIPYFTFDDCLCDLQPSLQTIDRSVENAFGTLRGGAQALARLVNCSSIEYSPAAYPSYTRNSYLSASAGLQENVAIYSANPSLYDCQGDNSNVFNQKSLVDCENTLLVEAYGGICIPFDENSDCANPSGTNTYIVLCPANTGAEPTETTSSAVSMPTSTSISTSSSASVPMTSGSSAFTFTFTGFRPPVPSSAPQTFPPACTSGPGQAFQNFCTFLDAFQKEISVICGVSAIVAVAQPELLPVVLEVCAGGTGQAALLDVVKDLAGGLGEAVTGSEIPTDLPSSACFVLHNYCGENPQYQENLRRSIPTGLPKLTRRDEIFDTCTSYISFANNPVLISKCDSPGTFSDLKYACSAPLFGPANVTFALQQICSTSKRLLDALPTVCKIAADQRSNVPRFLSACSTVLTADFANGSRTTTSSVIEPSSSSISSLLPVVSVSSTSHVTTAVVTSQSSHTSVLPTPSISVAPTFSAPEILAPCVLVKHYGDSPDTPDSSFSQPELPELPDFSGGYYYLCADGSVPPLSILPGTSVTASPNAGSASITAPINTKTSQAGCTMTRSQGDSPDTPDTPDSPNGQPEVPELPEISQDPSNPGYYWMCV